MQCSSFAKYCLVKIWKISNAVEVAINADDPNVVPVQQEEKVTVPAGQTPWQEVPIQYNDIVIPAGQLDTIGTPNNDNFIVTVASSQSASTLCRIQQLTAMAEQTRLP